jgi:large subunit ribosomal protein L22
MAAVDETKLVQARATRVRISPRKARLVTDHIRGRSVPEARTVLAFTTRAAAREIEKVLKSAVSNAEANHGLQGDDLYVAATFVDEGPTIKRFRARARGRASAIKKRTCHITIRVAELERAAGDSATAAAAEQPKRGKAPKTTESAAKPKTRSRAKKKEINA